MLKQISILGQKTKITHTIPRPHRGTFSPDNYQGLFFSQENVIWINKALPPKERIKTLFHEMGHAMFNRGGVKFTYAVNEDVEEIIVEQVSHMFYDLLFETDFYERAIYELTAQSE